MKYSMISLSVLIGLSVLILAGCNSSAKADATNVVPGNAGATEKNLDSNEYVRIPLSEVTEDLKKFTHNADGVGVVYFAVLGSDGEIRTAFDACDVCDGYKGYEQIGKDVRCKNCGKFFNVDDIGSKNAPGGCWPSYLDHKIEGDELLISRTELEAGRHRFL